MIKKYISYFFQGLLITVPLALTCTFLYRLFDWVADFFGRLGLTGMLYVDTLISLVGLIVILVSVGLLARSFLFTRMFDWFEDQLEHMPFVRHIYSPIKDFLSAFVGNKKQFKQAVLVTTNAASNIEELGFITKDDLSKLELIDKVAVYIPLSYSLSGRLLIVPKTHVRLLNIDSSAALKFIVSGGVSDFETDAKGAKKEEN